MDSQTKLYVTQVFDNDLVTIQKNKVTLTLPALHWNCHIRIKLSINV